MGNYGLPVTSAFATIGIGGAVIAAPVLVLSVGLGLLAIGIVLRISGRRKKIAAQ